MRSPSSRARSLVAAAVVAALVALGLQAAVAPAPAAALSGSAFDPGNIISDPVFKDSGSMDAAAVQAFLQARVSTCAPGATCLKDYRETTWDRPGSNGLCYDYAGRRDERASDIIVRVAQACGINPKVLLVLLQKEQALVTATAPSAAKYSRATGFGCPDTGPNNSGVCDAQYFGFFNQVYLASRQYLLYANNAKRYQYQAGRTNTIQWHPDPACGTSQVFIANQATAGLYIYTPYRPNAAALANLYGSGDGCSAYGNRNFWRLFNDWFGDSQSGGFFVRTAADPAVYLVAGDSKLPVRTLATLQAYSRLGSVGTVSDSYLRALPTGPELGRMGIAPDGTVSLVSGNRRHRVPSCAVVADYGYDCATLPRLTEAQVALLDAGPPLSATFRLSDSPVLWVADRGTRREVLDFQSLFAAGRGADFTVLDPAAVQLPVGPPIARTDVVVTARGTSAEHLLQADGASRLPGAMAAQTVLGQRRAGQLSQASIDALPQQPAQTGAVTDDAGTTWLLTARGRVRVDRGSTAGLAPRRWSAALLQAAPEQGVVPGQVFVRGTGSSTVLRAADGTARPVTAWEDLVALAGTGDPAITVLPDASVAGMAGGTALLAPAALVKSPSAADVWLVDGTGSRWRLPTFEVSAALGVPGRVREVSPVTLAGYTPRGDLSTTVTCAGARLVGLGGRLREVVGSTALPSADLDATTCARLPRGGAALTAPLSVREAGSSAVFSVGATAKQPVASWPALQRHTGSPAPVVVVVAPGALAAVPTGPTIS